MKNNRTGIILAGGKSTRMGIDKGFVKFNNKTFVKHIMDCLQPMVDEIIIISDNSDYDVFGVKRIADFIKDAGPLAGVYTGLIHSNTTNNIILSCDVPFIKKNILELLIKEENNNIDIIQVANEDKNMPLIGHYKKQCAPTLLKLLNSGERRMNFAINQLQAKTIVVNQSQNKYIRNINTPEDLRHELEY